MLTSLFFILVFPGFIFLSIMAVVFEFIDRRLYARFQNRQGPPWFQPVADFIKLISKEEIIPEEAEPFIFKALPVVALTCVISTILYIPIWSIDAVNPFYGDVIVVLYLLTIPTICFVLGGWYSASLYSIVGSVRTLTQLFAYEVPLFMSILGPAILADSWTFSGIARFYAEHPAYTLFNLPALFVAIVAVQGKLERVPFDIPEAETEIVGGAFTEYSGKLLAYFRMTIDIEMVVVASIIACIFLPFGLGYGPVIGFIAYLIKLFIIVFILAAFRSIMARMRIDQMVMFCWKYLAPIAILQIFFNLLIKGALK